ncbi:hypothetical protein niasHS_011333 [Heterodera schachtii]|uniref:Peptidase A2 domain-containing protein n=1 Tax=Heterodera schachtii TaxID=97005 RepID=A0ABD2IPH0_HETSC
MSQHGSTVMQSPLGSVNNCQFKAGQCEMEDRTLLMWDTNTTRACEFSKIGTWKGLQLDNVWISNEVSFLLTFSNSTRKVNSCGLNLIKSEEGFAVQDFPSDDSNDSSKRSRRTRSLESWVTESEMNSKLGYLDEQVREMLTLSFSQTIKSICEYMLETRRWAATALLSDPTTFARKLFQSGKLVAKVAGPELIKVWPCIELQAHDYEFDKIGHSVDSEFECFDKIPIKFRVKDNKRMAFIDPRTMILSSDARLAPCSEYRKQLIFVRGSLYEVDQIDAQVKQVNANRIDGFSLNLSLAPTYARHSFLHLALVNVSDFIGQFYDANLARESELTFQIKSEDTIIIKTLSEQWEQVSESIRNKMFGNWEQIGKIVMSVMIIIVFADFLIRFGLMIRDEYVGRGATRRMTFGGNKTQEIVKSPACLNMTDLNACVELGNEIELSPVKLIEPAQIQACKIAGKRRRPAKKTRFSFRTPKILIGLLIIFLPNAFANPDVNNQIPIQFTSPSMIYLLIIPFLVFITISVLLCSKRDADLPILPNLNAISPHHAVVQTLINSTPVRCLVDTGGASLTVAPRSVADELNCRTFSSDLEAMSASGHVIRLKEYAQVTLNIAGYTVRSLIYFVDDSEFTVARDYSVIVGWDVFEKLPPIKFDHLNGKFFVGENESKLCYRSILLLNDLRVSAEKTHSFRPTPKYWSMLQSKHPQTQKIHFALIALT